MRRTPLAPGKPLERRTPLRAHTQIQRSTPVRQVSTRRAKENRAYSMLRREFLTTHPFCQVCSLAATDVHHRRGRVGADLLDVDHWSALCRECHRLVTERPAWAIDLGLSESRIGRRA